VWFTDPTYGITVPGEGHLGKPEYADTHVFRFDPADASVSVVVSDVEQPNGLAFSPDELLLYVSDSSAARRDDGGGNHHIRVYDVRDGRTAKNGRTFAVVDPGVPDGFRVDVGGRVWTSSGDAVVVFAPDARELARIPVPEVVSNVCFGGPGGSDLYVTATTSLYRIATRTTGAERPPAAAGEDGRARSGGHLLS